jgi:adenylylsulfate kinase
MTHPYHQSLHVLSAQRVLRRRQQPHCYWFTGLSGAGKSTLANDLDFRLNQAGYSSYLLDGDRLRQGLNQDLGFEPADRQENMRRTAETARLMFDAGLIVLVALISPYAPQRQAARALFPPGAFSEIYVSCALTTCQLRDPKGIYQRHAQTPHVPLTGINAPYEPPLHPELILDTDQLTLTEATDTLWSYACHTRITPPNPTHDLER